MADTHPEPKALGLDSVEIDDAGPDDEGGQTERPESLSTGSGLFNLSNLSCLKSSHFVSPTSDQHQQDSMTAFLEAMRPRNHDLQELMPPPPPIISYSATRPASNLRQFLLPLMGVSFVLAVAGLALFLATRQDQEQTQKQPEQVARRPQPQQIKTTPVRNTEAKKAEISPRATEAAVVDQQPRNDRSLEVTDRSKGKPGPGSKTVHPKKSQRRVKYSARVARSRRRARARIRRLLRRKGKRVIRCFRRHRKRGRARLRAKVEVLPTGRAGTVTLRGKHSKTAAGNCIRGSLRSARYPKFRGGQPLKCAYLYVVR